MSAPLQTRAMPAHRALGFTMIELIVVMAVIGLLLSLAAPRYLASLERGKDQVVEHDLAQMRKAIDQLEPIFNYRVLYLGGGNSRKVEGKLPKNVKIVEKRITTASTGFRSGKVTYRNRRQEPAPSTSAAS